MDVVARAPPSPSPAMPSEAAVGHSTPPEALNQWFTHPSSMWMDGGMDEAQLYPTAPFPLCLPKHRSSNQLPKSTHQSLGNQKRGMIKYRATESTLLPTETVNTNPGCSSCLNPKTVQQGQSCTAAGYYCSEKDQAAAFIDPSRGRDKSFHSCTQNMHRHF